MDLFDNKKENKEEDGYIHEQLSLDFDISAEAPTDKAKASAPDKTAEKIEEKNKKVKKEKKVKKKKKSKGGLEDGHLSLGVGSFGKYLQDMRVRNNYSIAQVEQATKIKAGYIELLEMEKLSLELPSVYVLAYARKLCECYKVPEYEIVAIIDELKGKLDSSFPSDFIENINIDYEIDEGSQKKMRHFAWVLLGALIFFVALVSIAVFMLSAPAKPVNVNPPLNVAEKFNQDKLKVLQTPVLIEATELPAKTNR
jgi:transcriptional regulator with XRE-family HTH domain